MDRGWLAGAVTVITLFVLLGTLLLLLIDAQAAARAATMRASLAEVEGTNRAKDQFLAMLGHELRNPLAAIAAAGHVLDRAAAGRISICGIAGTRPRMKRMEAASRRSAGASSIARHRVSTSSTEPYCSLPSKVT